MALESVVFHPDPFTYDFTRSWNHGFGFSGEDNVDDHDQQEKGCPDHDLLKNGDAAGQGITDYCSPSSVGMLSVNNDVFVDSNNSIDSSPEICTGNVSGEFSSSPTVATGRRKRRRTRNVKNKEEVETQRITHIAVERNRRKLMNDYLAALRSMMPASYAQRGDQASIIGGAINFVKELEQLVQSLEVSTKRTDQKSDLNMASIFSNFFTFPQYSTCSSTTETNVHSYGGYDHHGHDQYMNNNLVHMNEVMGEMRSGAIADVEVTMVETHANIKVLMKRNPRQLLKMVIGLHSLRLMILHLNVTNVDDMILYTFSVKVEDNSQLTSMNEIAADVYEMVERIQEEAHFLPQ